MKRLLFAFDPAAPAVPAQFAQWPERLAGLSVECVYTPVPLQGPWAIDDTLRLAWACTPDGVTPSRHVCELLLRHDVEALSKSQQRDPLGVSAHADLAAAHAALPSTWADGPEGVALQIDGHWMHGQAGIEAAFQALQGFPAPW